MRRLIPALIVGVAAASVFAFRTFADVRPLRLKVVRQSMPAADGSIRVRLEKDTPIETLRQPYAVIWRVQNSFGESGRFTLRFDEAEICGGSVGPGRNRRFDCAVNIPELIPKSIEVTGPNAHWSLESMELATHHGSSHGLLRLFVFPKGSRSYQPPPVWADLLAFSVVALVMFVTPASLGRSLRRLHALLGVVLMALALLLLVGPWISGFLPIISMGSWGAAVGLLLLPRLWAISAFLVRRPFTVPHSELIALGRRLYRVLSARRLLLIRCAVFVFAASLAIPSLIFGVKTAAGADSLGYISQAYLWLAGELHVPYEPVIIEGMGGSGLLMTTLGYTLGIAPGTLVPTYPPGLPLLMAGMIAIFGVWGPFLITPIASAVLVVTTYLLGKAYVNRTAGIVAATLISISPAVVFASLWPMTDILAAALWTVVLLRCRRTTVADAALTGAIAGFAVLVRPNLAPLLVLVPAAWWHSTKRLLAPQLLAFAVAGLPFAVVLGWFNHSMFGSAAGSGYGSLEGLFRWQFVPVNLRKYPASFVQSQGWLMAALVAVGWIRGLVVVRMRLLAVAAALVLILYLPYRSFDEWWYLRFLLPAYPAMFVMAAAALVTWNRGLSRRLRMSLIAAVVSLVAVESVRFTIGERPYGFRDGEDRYAVAGTWVRDNLPQNAGLLTLQHSGSVRFYGGRMTFRYDWIPRRRFERVINTMTAAGYEPYLLIDEFEEDVLRKRFDPEELAFLNNDPLVEVQSSPRVRIYALSEARPDQSTIYVESGTGHPIGPARWPPMRWDAPAISPPRDAGR